MANAPCEKYGAASRWSDDRGGGADADDDRGSGAFVRLDDRGDGASLLREGESARGEIIDYEEMREVRDALISVAEEDDPNQEADLRIDTVDGVRVPPSPVRQDIVDEDVRQILKDLNEDKERMQKET